VGGFLTFMGKELHATDKQSWLSVGNTLAIAVTAPYVGYLQDVLGRRNITLSGSLLLMIGCVLVATAHGFSQAVTGMVVAGVGAGIGELTALAGQVFLSPYPRLG
jgi:MFS family permease